MEAVASFHMEEFRGYGRLLAAARWIGSSTGEVDRTLERAAASLTQEGVSFALAGGFAVLAHGYERFTNDVDLLVSAADLPRAMQVLRAAGFRGRRTPLGARLEDQQTGVVLDLLGTAFDGDEKALARARRLRPGGLPVISVAHLILMKIESGRSQDYSDVVELLKSGVSEARVRRYLRSAWPELVSRFDELAQQARHERVTRSRRRSPPERK